MSLADIADCIRQAHPDAPAFSRDALVRALHSRRLSCQRTHLSLKKTPCRICPGQNGTGAIHRSGATRQRAGDGRTKVTAERWNWLTTQKTSKPSHRIAILTSAVGFFGFVQKNHQAFLEPS